MSFSLLETLGIRAAISTLSIYSSSSASEAGYYFGFYSEGMLGGLGFSVWMAMSSVCGSPLS